MNKLPAFLALCLCAAHSSNSVAELAMDTNTTEEIEKLIGANTVRGAVVAIYVAGETRVAGVGRISRNDAAKPGAGTLFEIGSITKVFTALLAQRQVDAGNLEWDAPISRYLPDVEFTNEHVASITLRELASHSSGLPREPDNMVITDPMRPFADYERDDLLSFLASYNPESLTREYFYSNLGAGLLGAIAADAAGLSFADAMSRDVLRPLGMLQTRVASPQDGHDNMASGFSGGADVPAWDDMGVLAGAGAMVSNADNLLTFIDQNLGDSVLRKTLSATLQPQGSGETGLGWHISKIDDGDNVYWHNGGTAGFSSFLAIRPANDTGIVVLATSSDHTAITDLGFEQISGQRSDEPSHATGELDALAGSYRLAEGFVLSVFADKGRLYGQATGQAAFPLSPTTRSLEFENRAADIRIVFAMGETGLADSLVLHQAGRETPGPRIDDSEGPRRRQEINVEAEVLRDYVGRYQLAESVVISVEVHGEHLFASLTGQAALPVFAYEQDRFFYKVVDAQLHFERDGEGRVVAVVLHQGAKTRAPRIQ